MQKGVPGAKTVSMVLDGKLASRGTILQSCVRVTDAKNVSGVPGGKTVSFCRIVKPCQG